MEEKKQDIRREEKVQEKSEVRWEEEKSRQSDRRGYQGSKKGGRMKNEEKVRKKVD